MTMRKEGIQTRKRKPKSASNGNQSRSNEKLDGTNGYENKYSKMDHALGRSDSMEDIKMSAVGKFQFLLIKI